MMAINMASKKPDELKTLIANHERAGKTDSDRYRAAVAELATRNSGDLSLEKTVKVITNGGQARQLHHLQGCGRRQRRGGESGAVPDREAPAGGEPPCPSRRDGH